MTEANVCALVLLRTSRRESKPNRRWNATQMGAHLHGPSAPCDSRVTQRQCWDAGTEVSCLTDHQLESEACGLNSVWMLSCALAPVSQSCDVQWEGCSCRPNTVNSCWFDTKHRERDGQWGLSLDLDFKCRAESTHFHFYLIMMWTAAWFCSY